METNNDNSHHYPESNINPMNLDMGVKNFERFSAWGVFGLSIITLGFYPLYWLYTRITKLNSFHSKEISPILLKSLVALMIVQLLLFLFIPEGAVLSDLTAIFYIILYLVVLFTFRNRLVEITRDKINPVITLFFGTIYLQYKINKCIDLENDNAEEITKKQHQ